MRLVGKQAFEDSRFSNLFFGVKTKVIVNIQNEKQPEMRQLGRDPCMTTGKTREIRRTHGHSRASVRGEWKGFCLLVMCGFSLMSLSCPVPAWCVDHVRCGVDILLKPELVQVPLADLALAAPSARGQKNTSIVLLAGPGLQSQPEVLAAWNSAVAVWESWLEDSISIVIEGDLQALPENILGSTSPLVLWSANNFDLVRNAVRNDAGADEGFLSGLPTSTQFNVMMPAGFSFAGAIMGTKANLKALNFDMSAFDGDPDATIIFSTGFLPRFDFDPSDGIDSDKIDFEAVVIHEIGHALGFGTAVDVVDIQRAQGEPGPVSIYPLDLFRLLPDQGTSNFTQATRVITTGDLAGVQMFYEGVEDIQMATGVNFGDGRQASHWKDDEVTDVFIGIMDPTLPPGQREELTEADLRAFGLIGWDVADEPGPSEPPPDPPEAPPPFLAQITNVYPNPFNPKVTVQFSVTRAAEVRLDVYDLQGKLVRKHLSQIFSAGVDSLSWNGMRDDGSAASSGLYFLSIVTGAGTESRKAVLMK